MQLRRSCQLFNADYNPMQINIDELSLSQDSHPTEHGEEDCQGLDKDVLIERIIVDRPALLSLFRVCSTQGCGALIDPGDVVVHTHGAAMTVRATCLENHEMFWKSSSIVGEGRKQIFVVNILLAAYTLFCGLNISQVCS